MEYPDFESSTLEFKEKIPTKDQILKTVIAFCNLHGGRILIGISDARKVVGVDEAEVEKWMEFLDKNIYESCSPPIVPDIHTQRIGGKIILNVGVSMGMQKPYFLKSLGLSKGVYIRLGRSTVRADYETIEDLNRQARRIAYDCTVIYNAKVEEINPDLFQKFLQSRRLGANGNQFLTSLKAYHAVGEDQSKQYPTIGGLLLFNANPQQWFPEAFIICSVFSNHTERKVVATRDSTGSLFEQFESAFDFITSFLNKSFEVKGKRRLEKFEIPLVALREALLNAVVHRNYSVSGPIKVAIYPNQIEIFSPGVFPGPIDVTKLTSGITYIRNTAIAKVFREAGYVEKLGSGFITMFRTYQEMNLKPPLIVEGENFVKCILPREILKSNSTGIDDGSEQILRLFLENDSISINDVVTKVGFSKATAGRKLRALENKKQLTRKGKGPATLYVQSSKTPAHP